MCGGTDYERWSNCWFEGLSPRVRGNRNRWRCRSYIERTIPACAGEPGADNSWPSNPTDYPRVCGGTFQSRILTFLEPGLSPRVRGNPPGMGTIRSSNELSPRVRGNPYILIGIGRAARTIPACAGEPKTRQPPDQLLVDYPRVCGGTCSFPRTHLKGQGLSPRVRGNLSSSLISLDTFRTIPACAGEPE